MTIDDIINDNELLEIGRRAVEDELISFRESRLSQLRGNGLVIKEIDGTPSSVIRFGMETALVIALRAIKAAKVAP